MDFKQQKYTNPLEDVAPILLLLSGWIFCVVVKLINVGILAFGNSVKANYLISTSSYGVSYFWFCEVIFAGFIAIGLLSLIRDKGKICSAILIISCLAMATNVAVIKATIKKGHMQSILVLETALKRAETEPASEPYLSPAMSIYRGRYTELVNLWNELHNNKYDPVAGLTLSEVEQAKLIQHVLYLGEHSVPYSERTNVSPQLLNPLLSISNQCSFIITSVHQLAAATNSPCISIEQRNLWKLDDRDEFKFHSGSASIPVGAKGWFRCVSHSMHSDKYWETAIGDLHIGRDHMENYYFSRKHVCSGHSFKVGPSKAYTSMQDLLARNTSWHLIPNIEEWKASNKFVDPISEPAHDAHGLRKGSQ